MRKKEKSLISNLFLYITWTKIYNSKFLCLDKPLDHFEENLEKIFFGLANQCQRDGNQIEWNTLSINKWYMQWWCIIFTKYQFTMQTIFRIKGENDRFKILQEQLFIFICYINTKWGLQSTLRIQYLIVLDWLKGSFCFLFFFVIRIM